MLDLNEDQIVLAQWVDSSEPLVRTLPVSGFARLASRLHDTQGNVEIKLQFRRADQGKSSVKGTINTIVQALCQRTLAPFSYPLSCDVNLTFVRTDEETEDLSGDSDPVLCADGVFSLKQLIEDELILSLPIVFRSNDTDNQGEVSAKSAMPTSETRKPFLDLKALMSRNND